MAAAYASDVPEDIINIFNSDSDNEFLGFNSDDNSSGEQHVLATVNAISTETNSDIEIDSDVSDDDDDLADNFDTGTAFTEPVWSNNLDET